MMELMESKEKVSSSSSLGYKLVPWVDWDQWNYIKKSIFSSSPKSIAAALCKIKAWKSRGCLPIAIDITAAIIEIQQIDPFFRRDGSIGTAINSEEMLSMLYCMSIMRLVNGSVEPAHKKTGRSISDLAKAFGIPRTLVDIRHESSHRDLPSLKLVRSASAKALEWLKANYWEPQSIAIYDPRKEIKSVLHKMILCLRSRHASSLNSTKNRRKSSKRTPCLVACRKLSHISERMQALKSEGSTKQISRITRIAVRLYSLYPSEVVSLLLDFFQLQLSDISGVMDFDDSECSIAKPNVMDFDDSECSIAKPIVMDSDDSEYSIAKPSVGSLTDLKMIITKLSNKKPRLLLSMLKIVLRMIEEKDYMNIENDGKHLLSSQNQAEVSQISHLRSLAHYLVRNLKALKDSGKIGVVEGSYVLSTNKSDAPKVFLTNLLHKCLRLLVPGDKHLLKSVLILAEMSGNSLLTKKLKKLPLLAVLEQDASDADFCYNESMLLKEEDSIKKATKKLELINARLMNRKDVGRRHNSDAITCKWTVAKSWVSSPIGTLPCSISSTAVIPVLDVMEDGEEADDKSETTGHNVEKVCSASKNEMACNVETFDDGNPVKKMKQTSEDQGLSTPENFSPMEGRLLIGGLWKKVSDEELLDIESKIRIFF